MILTRIGCVRGKAALSCDASVVRSRMQVVASKTGRQATALPSLPRYLSTTPTVRTIRCSAENISILPRKRPLGILPQHCVPLAAPFHFSLSLPRRPFSSVQTNDDSNGDAKNFGPSRSIKVAVVGSGPSGCYTAKYLFLGATSDRLSPEKHTRLQVDVLERLPTPYGLVRNGVAPDHPEVKNVQNDFDALFEEYGAKSHKNNDADHKLSFYGNVTVGGGTVGQEGKASADVSLEELRSLYDVVVLAYGCESDRELDLPVDAVGDGEHPSGNLRASDIEGILSAREFVNWYNGHPDFAWVTEKVKTALQDTAEPGTQSIVVVGHGNVALDCARILAKSRGTLDPTDLTTRAMDVLRPKGASFQRSVSVVGRRGHPQAAFTIKEARELTKLAETDDARLILREDELERGGSTEASQQELKARPRARIHKLLRGHAQAASHEEATATTAVHLRFLTNPVRFRARPNGSSSEAKPYRLSGVVCERTELVGGVTGSQRARGTGATEAIDADLCLVSIGYKGLAIDATTSACFDNDRGILTNTAGRVAVAANDLAPLYAAGWLKRGPSGIIGTNIGDAKETVHSILQDMDGIVASQTTKASPTASLDDLLASRGVDVVDWDAYRRIEAAESSEDHKRHPDQPREKLVDREELLRAAAAK